MGGKDKVQPKSIASGDRVQLLHAFSAACMIPYERELRMLYMKRSLNVFGAFTSDVPTVQQLLASVLRSENDKILEGYDKSGHPIYRAKGEGKFELRTRYVEQKLDEEPQRRHVIPFSHQQLADTPEGLPAIQILSADRQTVLSTIRHINMRFGELSAEAIMDRVLGISNDLGAHVLISCVCSTAKQGDLYASGWNKSTTRGYTMSFIESAPAKGWEKRML